MEETNFQAMTKYIASLFLIFMGSMDCATTVVGTHYFGTQELNPIMADLVHSNLPAFVVVKLTVTVAVGVIFVLAEKTLMNSKNKTDRSFKIARNTLRVAYIGVMVFLTIVVTNNIIVLLGVM
ncbi:DUF5658 family protein [Candidatus Bathycorpusculum sp.]|uniref:DUF5658 family protein n=1 Tax=Candidatus Bathycorpusculum sp. TaxID=2994959 RepID=UPI002832844A|nr:DUF5658 family protein [Candidatus Termitimicrobium sp.]